MTADLSKLGKVLGEYLIAQLALELSAQGHNMTGNLIASLESKIKTTAEGLVIEMFSAEYGEVLNTGIPAERVPYRQGSGAKSSAFIAGLTRFAERRMGLRGKDATRVAFAIARKMKREGMPTRNSYAFSRNGRRTRWVDAVLEENEPQLGAIILQFVGEHFEFLIYRFIKKASEA